MKYSDMKEILFIVEESQDGGYFAHAVNPFIITQGDSLEELRSMISEAIRCHFAEEELPEYIHLHVTHKETFAL